MSDENATVEPVVREEDTEAGVASDKEAVIEDQVDNSAEDTGAKETESSPEADETQEVKQDLVSEALAEQERLKAELEALKSQDSDVFEKNAILKAELEDAKKLAEMASENADLKGKLDGIKREAITNQLISSGAITGKMKDWVDTLTFDQLQEFAANAPKRKTILDQTNSALTEPALEMVEWQKKQSKSRIIS